MICHPRTPTDRGTLRAAFPTWKRFSIANITAKKRVISIAYLYVGIGGFLGSCLRYLFSVLCKNTGIIFPLGTLLANVTAGFLIGFAIGTERQTDFIPPRFKLFFNTGLLGGLSTFSTFSLETVELFSSGKYSFGAINVLLNILLSFLGVVMGMTLAESIFKKI